MAWGNAGGYAGDPRGRESAIEDRQQGRDDVQSQIDSFSQMPIYDRGSPQDRMRFRTYSAPLPTPKTPVQKAYTEIRTKTPDMTAKKSVTPTPKDVKQVSIVDTSYTPPASKTDSAGSVSTATKVALANLLATGTAYGTQVAKHLLTHSGKSLIPSQMYSKFNPGAPTGVRAWWGSGPTTAAKIGSRLGYAGLVGIGSYLGTAGLLKGTGGQDFYSKLGSKIAQKTGATTTPQSSWSDLLAWANKQTSQMEGN